MRFGLCGLLILHLFNLKNLMKHLFIYFLSFLFSSAYAQTIGAKVTLTAVDGKIYTGAIIEIENGKYKVKYDGFDFSAWLVKEQFTLLENNNQAQAPNKNIQVAPAQILNQKVNRTSPIGKLYSGSSFNGNVYYYMLPSGKLIKGCPRGGMENFDFNAACAQSPGICGNYSIIGQSFNIIWNDNRKQSGKISPNGDIDIDGSLIGEMHKVPNTLSASYDFGVILGGTSVAETTTFHSDGTFVVKKVGGVDTGDGKNSSEFSSIHSGKYRINGFTITMTENAGKVNSHTIYSIDKETANPDYLGWDGNFLTKIK